MLFRSSVLTDFGIPKVIGGSYNVLATDIYKEVVGQQNFAMGAVVSVVLLVLFGLSLPYSLRRDKTKAGAQVARRVADRHPGVYVMGDVGPLGELMEPMGTMTPDEATTLFAEQMQGLVDGGVDAILIETMSDLGEMGDGAKMLHFPSLPYHLIALEQYTHAPLDCIHTRPDQQAHHRASLA